MLFPIFSGRLLSFKVKSTAASRLLDESLFSRVFPSSQDAQLPNIKDLLSSSTISNLQPIVVVQKMPRNHSFTSVPSLQTTRTLSLERRSLHGPIKS